MDRISVLHRHTRFVSNVPAALVDRATVEPSTPDGGPAPRKEADRRAVSRSRAPDEAVLSAQPYARKGDQLSPMRALYSQALGFQMP